MFDVWLADFEASFLRLVEKLTNGTRLEIDTTGERCGFWECNAVVWRYD